MIEMIAFDADDTLWHNERDYHRAAQRLQDLLAPYHPAETVEQALFETEMRNLAAYGYGLKAFTLSMIETAVALSNGQLSSNMVQALLDGAKEMVATDVELLPGVADALQALSPHYKLMVITKGDLLDQERKLARSGLADTFAHFEVVSNKTPEVYAAILQKHDLTPQHFMMIGNSLRSDVLPVVELGATAVYIPHDLTWAHETHVEPHADDSYHTLAHINDLPDLLRKLEKETHSS